MGVPGTAAAGSMGDLLVLDGVVKRFAGVEAVKGLSWRVPEGVVYGLIGPNGSGKTTTIRMILDIFSPDEGKIEVFGRRADARTRDLVGYLPEERGLYKKMRVADVLLYLGRLKGVSTAELKRSIAAWLEKLGLGQCGDRRVEDLSKGMQQKVQFIATVLHGPKLLILDEPFSGLDPVSADLLKDSVLEMKKKGCTILLSTHAMEAAEKLCDSVLMLYRGSKVLDGPLAALRREHGGDAVARGVGQRLRPVCRTQAGERRRQPGSAQAPARPGEGAALRGASGVVARDLPPAHWRRAWIGFGR
jgi:ABC-2 type transport system ATP-binding protein